MEIKTALVVDDSKTARLTLKKKLSKQNIGAELASSGEEAIEFLQANDPPDVIFMDVMMPGMGGYEATKEIVGNDVSSGIPIVMCTSKDTAEDKQEAMDNGATEFMVKPVSDDRLAQIVRSLQNMPRRQITPMKTNKATTKVPASTPIAATTTTQSYIPQAIDQNAIRVMVEKIAMQTAEKIAVQIATSKAKLIAESIAVETATSKAKSIAETTAKETSEKIAKEIIEPQVKRTVDKIIADSVGDKVKAIAESVATKVSQTAAEGIVEKIISDIAEEKARDSVTALVEQTAEEIVKNTAEKKTKQIIENIVEQEATNIINKAIESNVQSFAKESAASIVQEIAKPAIEKIVDEVAQSKARSSAAKIANKVAEESAKIMAEKTANKVAKTSATTIANDVAEEIARDRAQVVANKVAIEVVEQVVGKLAEQKATEIAEKTAISSTKIAVEKYIESEASGVIQSIIENSKDETKAAFDTLRKQTINNTQKTILQQLEPHIAKLAKTQIKHYLNQEDMQSLISKTASTSARTTATDVAKNATSDFLQVQQSSVGDALNKKMAEMKKTSNFLMGMSGVALFLAIVALVAGMAG